MSGRTTGIGVRSLVAAFVLGSALAACDGRLVRFSGMEFEATGPASVGSAQAVVTLKFATGTVAHVSMTVSAGDGPAFAPITVALQANGSSWTAFVTGIPVGRGREFQVAALDGTGATLVSGLATSDVAAGAVAMVSIVLYPSTQPYETTAPEIDYVAASTTDVEPLMPVTVRASAHDSTALTYQWTSTCGGFDLAASSTATWTAPARGGVTCDLTITVSDGGGNTSSATFAISVAAGRTISGFRLVTYWPDPPAGQVTLPAADVATARAPTALALTSSGQWVAYPGGSVGSGGSFVQGPFGADGSFVVPNVPPGAYTLCYEPPGGAEECTDTSADVVDLGYDTLGRADQTAAAASTPVTFSLGGLDPWDPLLEEIQVTSSGANLWDSLPDVFLGGVTAGSVGEDWDHPNVAWSPLHLLEPSDLLFVHQLSARPLYSGNSVLLYTAATDATLQPPDPSALTGIGLSDGAAAGITAALQSLPLSASITVAWSTSQFEAVAANLAPAQRIALGARAHELVVGASAWSLPYPAPAAAGFPELVKFALPAGAGDVSETFYYGQFLPSLWKEWCGARFGAQVQYLVPGATTPFVDVAGVEQRSPLPLVDAPLVPAIGPVLELRIHGSDALQDHTGVTGTPTLSWSAPSTGQPTAYLVEVFRLLERAGATTSSLVLRYTTSNTAVTLPPNVLQGGGLYYAKVTAEVSGVPYDTAPFRTANVFARATSLTGTFMP